MNRRLKSTGTGAVTGDRFRAYRYNFFPRAKTNSEADMERAQTCPKN